MVNFGRKTEDGRQRTEERNIRKKPEDPENTESPEDGFALLSR